MRAKIEQLRGEIYGPDEVSPDEEELLTVVERMETALRRGYEFDGDWIQR